MEGKESKRWREEGFGYKKCLGLIQKLYDLQQTHVKHLN
jgi:hypothetical protein